MLGRRPKLTPPVFGSLPLDLRKRLQDSSSMAVNLGWTSARAVRTAPPQLFSPLEDRLSWAYTQLNDTKPVDLRSEQEESTLRAFDLDDINEGLMRPSTARPMLAALRDHVAGDDAAWRGGEAHLGADAAGHTILLPTVGCVQSQLRLLSRVISTPAPVPPLFTASVVHVLLLNCHPFRDANGRVARILFNFVLRRSGMPATVYVPLYEIGLRARGGYEIALRRAEIAQEWEHVFGYMAGAIACCHEMAPRK